jgi:hypothetical protein
MQNSNMFLKVDVLDKKGNVQVKYINKNHILTICQDAENIVIEMTDYEYLRVPNQNIHVFMDRFK